MLAYRFITKNLNPFQKSMIELGRLQVGHDDWGGHNQWTDVMWVVRGCRSDK